MTHIISPKISAIKSYLLVVCLISFAPVYASVPYQPTMGDPVNESWRWSSLPVSDGLRCLVEGEDGTLWFGIDEGVKCYDGLVWTTYTSKDGLVGAPTNALFATQDGRIYAGSDMGISEFFGGRWHHVFPLTISILRYSGVES